MVGRPTNEAGQVMSYKCLKIASYSCYITVFIFFKQSGSHHFNSRAVSFLENKWGTQVQENMKMKKKILHLAEINNISLQVRHISGDLNVIVDKQSENNRGFRQSGVDTNRPVCNINQSIGCGCSEPEMVMSKSVCFSSGENNHSSKESKGRTMQGDANSCSMAEPSFVPRSGRSDS